MRILVVGAGATGGFYGGKLALAGRDVTFLVRERRAHQLKERGLEIVGHTGEVLRLQPEQVTAAELRAKPKVFDLVVMSTKSYQLAEAMNDVAPAVGAETLLLPVLNGMGQLATLEERFGAENVLGGTCRVFSDVDAEGRIVLMAALDDLSYGELSGERSARIVAVDREMQGCGFTAMLQPDILAAMWQKWAMLSSLGALCILTRGSVGEVQAAPRGRSVAEALVHECMAIAGANGYALPPAMIETHLRRLTAAGSTLTSSLYRDMMKGAPVEADHILGDLLERAKDVPAPLLTAAFVQLKVYEAVMARGGAPAGTVPVG